MTSSLRDLRPSLVRGGPGGRVAVGGRGRVRGGRGSCGRSCVWWRVPGPAVSRTASPWVVLWVPGSCRGRLSLGSVSGLAARLSARDRSPRRMLGRSSSGPRVSRYVRCPRETRTSSTPRGLFLDPSPWWVTETSNIFLFYMRCLTDIVYLTLLNVSPSTTNY